MVAAGVGVVVIWLVRGSETDDDSQAAGTVACNP